MDAISPGADSSPEAARAQRHPISVHRTFGDVKSAELASLRSSLGGVSIEAYFGTWCGDSRKQIPRLLRLLRLNPKSVIGHGLLSEAFSALGRRDEALAAIERALSLEPQDKRALRTAETLRRH